MFGVTAARAKEPLLGLARAGPRSEWRSSPGCVGLTATLEARESWVQFSTNNPPPKLRLLPPTLNPHPKRRAAFCFGFTLALMLR